MKQTISPSADRQEVGDEELRNVIADFLEMGHVDNIVAMFKADRRYYSWTGTLLEDERIAVRLGVSVLFEYLVAERPEDVKGAIPGLVSQLAHTNSMVRGEALSVLAIIDLEEAHHHARRLLADPDPQVREIAREIINEQAA